MPSPEHARRRVCTNNGTQHEIEFVATINLQPFTLIQVGKTLLGTVGVMLLILEVDVTMRQRGLVANNEATEFGLVAWQK